MVVELIILIIVFIIIIFLWINRYEIFGVSPNLTNEEYINLGYGFYSSPEQTECINSSGLCSEKGVISEISYCIPNATTKKGCIGENGYQTYDIKINQTGCTTSCRYSIWSNEINTGCFIPFNDLENNNFCIKKNKKGISLTKKKCIQNDAYGINTCSYEISTFRNKIYPGCYLTGNGHTVNCNVGSEYIEIRECNNLNIERCGEWINDKSCGTYVDNPYEKSNECFSFENGKLLTKSGMFGYTRTKSPYKCSSSICGSDYKNELGAIDENTIDGRRIIHNNSLKQISTIGYNNGEYPVCLKSCISN